MADDLLPAAPAPTTEYCYRHPGTATGVHCTRCGRPICTECMVEAPVGFQCPECVADARRQFRQGPGRPLRGGVSVTIAILAAIVVVYAIEVVVGGPESLFGGPNGQELVDLGAMQPILIASGEYWRLFTAMFLHIGLLHILFNGYALWLFGRQVEMDYGRTNMILIYFVSGFLASVASYAWSDPRTVSAGASGAIFGIFGAFVAYNYRRRHLVSASANLRSAVTMLLLNGLLAIGYGGIDWRAHVGGFVAGVACGLVAEGWGSASQRRLIRVLGYASIVAIGVALTVWRTNELRSVPWITQVIESLG